ncbi:MAG: hypothetical protein V4726_20330 [Verrucomicrobiota bacterium]
MINPFLAARLQPVVKLHRQRQLALSMTLWWSLAAVAGWALFLRGQPPLSTEFLPDYIVMALLGAGAIWVAWYLTPTGFRGIARRIERRFPALDGRLLTAVQVDQEDDGEGKPAFIRERLLSQAMQHSLDHDWRKAVGPLAGVSGQVAAGLGLLAFALVLWSVPRGADDGLAEAVAPVSSPEESVKLADGVEVTPGDTLLEKGSNLVVLVKFSQSVPENVSLVAGNTPETSRRVPLTRSLRDPVFGGSLPDVREDFRYHIDYDGRSTREFTVRVFEYPRLERSDVVLNYPDWTKLPEKRIEDTLRVSAVEGSRVSLTLKLNKPVVSATLKPRDSSAKEIALEVTADKPVASLTNSLLTVSGTYELILKDDAGRLNKVPPVFTFEALPNSAPEIKLAQPRGDQTPSPLEELVFAGTARDDFGLLTWGLAFTMGGGDPEYLELGKGASGGEMRNFDHLLRLEEKAVKPDDLVSWFVWADDIGPDGKQRRTEGDLFFGEVREFDQIFRRGQDQAGGQQQQQQQQGGAPQGAGAKLAELQKQVINATWKLRRSASPAKADISVVRDSQNDALTQAEEAAAEAGDARLAALWEKAKGALKKAAESLKISVDQPETLPASLAAEQTAYQALLKLQAKEFEITKNRSQSSGSQSEAEKRMQEELNEMELTEEKNRYEKESEAKASEEAERREDRQVLNRLQELAKRQEEVNEKLKDLQTALQAAETPEQREALERELKRLEDEQREMLADVDELNQRMERPENQSRMAEEKKQLEQVRENARQASEEASKGNAAQALASGTRAQEQLKEMREEMRTKTSSGFSNDLRDMRSEARKLASEQRKVNDQLRTMEDPKQKTLGDDGERDAALRTLAEQKRRSEQLTKKAAEISESAESAEPLVSRQLYDSMRKYAQDDAAGVKQAQEEMLRSGDISRQMYRQIQEMQNRQEGAKTLDLTSDLLSEDLLAQAQSTGKSAESGIEDFKSGIERAAESVVGDDTEALKRADRELESLTKELERELAEATGEPADGGSAGNGREAGAEGQEPGGQDRSQAAAGQGKEGSQEPGQSDQGGRGENSEKDGQPGSSGAEQGPEGQEKDGKGQSSESGSLSQDEAGQSGKAPGEAQAGKGQDQGQDQDQGQGQGQGQAESEGKEPGQNGDPQGQGKGEGQAQGQDDGQGQEAGNEPGQSQGEGQGQSPGQRGQGQGRGQQEGQGSQQGQGEGQPGEASPSQEGAQPGQGQEGQQGQGQGQGRGEGQGQDGREDGNRGGQEQRGPSGENRSGRGGGGGGGSRGGSMTAGGRGGLTAPIGGDGYGEWSDSLRDVQEMVEFPDLQNRIANVRESARQMRVDVKRDLKKPDWAVVKAEILTPLVEVRKNVREELLRRQSDEALVPIDRDPVPGRYSEQVRRYYEQLGKD